MDSCRVLLETEQYTENSSDTDKNDRMNFGEFPDQKG